MRSTIKSSLNQKTSNIVGQMYFKGNDLLEINYDFLQITILENLIIIN